jgi:hypothetical protein
MASRIREVMPHRRTAALPLMMGMRALAESRGQHQHCL